MRECPRCGNDSAYVVETRRVYKSTILLIRRKLACKECTYYSTTVEVEESKLNALQEKAELPPSLKKLLRKLLDGL